ncbi:pentapeptide repeat-containing protein [Romboutsia lituseburensis]|uniref:pentapeptide repeat-containing protein n=1 Tax=Romboutsia lituseburensis TaxID=1537 RepID=UPI00215A535E|nr:pentapeptide repeat-containing protein [Romboutsia lituseburensis]MCR8744953.1 pentapeptide repeat-containing protein [Romboutsia lituseburensis]
MAYINFKEEKAVLEEQLEKRKKNNEKLYIDIVKQKVDLTGYVPDSTYSYNKIENELIGKKGLYDEDNFMNVESLDIICSKFIGCSFRNVKFKECRFIGCTFEECIFNGGGVVFENCRFVKEESEKLPALNKKDNLSCIFYKCEIYSKFLNCDNSYLIFEKCKIRNTSIELTAMNNVIVMHSELSVIDIVDSDLSGFKTYECYIEDIQFDDKYKTKFDEKTFFDKIEPRVKDKEEYEGIYMTYESLANKFKENTLNNNFGEYYYLGKCTERKCLNIMPKIGSYLYWLLCGYGERPWFCVLSSLGIIFIFSIIYLITGMDLDGEIVRYTLSNINTWSIWKFFKDLNESINLSVGMFAGVGCNNSKPTELSYTVANMEMLVGVVMMGLGIGTLTRKVVR